MTTSMLPSTLPMADEAARMALQGYRQDLIKEIETRVRDGIAASKLQIEHHVNLEPTFDASEKPFLTAAVVRHFNAKLYKVDVEYYGGGNWHSVVFRISWFPKA